MQTRNRRHWLQFSAALAGTATLPLFAQAGYPNRPITIIVPFGPGGNADALTRTIGERLSRHVGQPVVLDFKPGAGGALGLRSLAAAKPDGYTLSLGSASSLAAVPQLRNRPPYDPLKDFEPLSYTAAAAPLWLVAKAPLNVRTLGELVAYAKKNPGKLSYGSAGIGSATHVAGEEMAAIGKLDMVHVPYKGGAQVIQALIGGEIDFAFSGVPAPLEYIKSGKLVALATAGAERSQPDMHLPTVAEQGFPGFDFGSWWGFVAPAGTPREIVKYLSEGFAISVRDPAIKAKLEAQGYAVSGAGSDEFRQLIARDNRKWADISRRMNLKTDD